MLFGAYTLFNSMPPSSPLFDTTQITKDDTGALKAGNPLAEPAVAIHAERESELMRSVYGHNLAYLDVQTYSSLTKGPVDQIDQDASSTWAKTLGEGIASQKTWMRDLQETMEGPLLGEGSIATQNSNQEWLWAGYSDSVQRVINMAAGGEAWQLPPTSTLAPTVAPVIPEYELRVFAQTQANHGNGFYQRFFSAVDPPSMVQSDGSVILPLTEAAHDRYRLYELTYGHTAFLTSNGPFASNSYVTKAGMVKEHYMLNELQRHYLTSPVDTIEYWHAGALRDFEQVLFATETVDTFRDPRIRLRFEDGLEVYLNHGPSSWTVAFDGTTYTLPEDGFVAGVPGSGLLAFSAAAPGTGGNRIDYCTAPERYTLFDGRGAVNSYGGLSSSNAHLTVVNHALNLTLTSDGAGNVQVQQGAPPALVGLELEPPALALSPADRTFVRVWARYANGAKRDVTKQVQWSSSNPSVFTINSGAALTTCGTGTATLTASFGGQSESTAVIVN